MIVFSVKDLQRLHLVRAGKEKPLWNSPLPIRALKTESNKDLP
jgi:hypothetical protein